MDNPFLTAVKKFNENPRNPDEILFQVINKAIDDFFYKLNKSTEKLNLRGNLSLDVYIEDFKNKFYEIKLDEKGGWKYLAGRENDTEAKRTLIFLIKQYNNELGKEFDEDFSVFLELLKDTLHFLNGVFELQGQYAKKTAALLPDASEISIIDIIDDSNKQNKDYRINIALTAFEILSEKPERRENFNKLRDEVKIKLGIAEKEAAPLETNFDEGEDNRRSLIDVLPENSANNFSNYNEEQIEKKLNEFFASLSEKETLVFIAAASSDYYNDSFSGSMKALSAQLNIRKSVIYEMKKKVYKKFNSHFEDLEQEEKEILIKRLKNSIEVIKRENNVN